MPRPSRNAPLQVASLLGVICMLVTIAGCGVPLAWDSREELIEVAPNGIEKVALTTHNGKIRVRGVEDPNATIEITAKIEAGANSPEAVRACLEAVEIVVTDAKDETLDVSWRWREAKQSAWNAKVSFDAIVPARLSVMAESQNGEIDVNGAEGACQLKSQNGRIRALGGSTSMNVETQNGEIFLQTAAPEVSLVSHNGAIDAVLKSSEPINGNVETHNGGILLAVNPWSSTKLTASTHNGGIQSQLPLDNQQVEKKSISGLLGDGEGKLTVTTHNGTIALRAAEASAPQPDKPVEEDAPQAEGDADGAEPK